jgi:uncharacterized protein (TIGR02186 family)
VNLFRALICLIVAVAAILPAQGAAGAAGAERLIADLSKYRVSISIGFTGTDVLLFGATGGKGDIVVVVRGPRGKAVVRRKARVAGIWINRDRREFEGVPAFYTISASKPLEQILSPAVAKRHGIGLDNLGIRSTGKSPSASETPAFEAALLRLRRGSALYSAPQGRGACSDKSLVDEPGTVRFLGERLFRTTVCFPSNVSVGTYLVQVFLIRDGQVVSAQTTPLFVNRAGIDAAVFDFAHRWPAFYGLIAVALAVMAGLAAGQIFRRR